MPLLKSLEWRVNYKIRKRELRRISSIPELYTLAQNHNEARYLEFIFREDVARKQLSETENFITALDLEFEGKEILELGPGYGHFLDEAKANNARTTFLDYNPYIHRLNQLKEHQGFIHDYTTPKAFRPVSNLRFDIILCKASINADRVNREYHLRWNGSFIKKEMLKYKAVTFDEWVRRVVALLKPQGIIIIAPSYDQTPEDKQPCQDVPAMADSWFTQIMFEGGFRLMQIEGLSDPVYFPFVFVLDRRSQ